ncbi:hypothetical protein CTAYLR_002700 [Chrysophaeum taylorii]|uniref:AAA+ ATPase domain-containing protein n=1 Tax=Chrysophaeum taylorii TaxID=2483200 RepID=A0AAD7UBS4_9STRA|nr:hypothetical protein CTAYLR_002700 [Chrysophaeum taylorii]
MMVRGPFLVVSVLFLQSAAAKKEQAPSWSPECVGSSSSSSSPRRWVFPFWQKQQQQQQPVGCPSSSSSSSSSSREEKTRSSSPPKWDRGSSGRWIVWGAVASALAVSAKQMLGLFVTRARLAVESRVWTTVEISEADDPKLYRAIVRWLHGRDLLRSGSYKALSAPDDTSKQQQQKQHKERSRATFKPVDDVSFVPLTTSGDTAQFVYRGRRVWARLGGVPSVAGGDPIRAVVSSMRPGAARRAAKAAARQGSAPLTILISTLNTSRDSSQRGGLSEISELLKEALLSAETQDKKYVEVYEIQQSTGRWELSCLARKRPLDTVILKKGLVEDLVQDVRTFVDDEDWYRRRSLPHRRGYLLWGPPGAGKSSVILAIASHFGLPLCTLALGRLGAGASKIPLSEALAAAPPCSVVAIEDVDVAFNATGALDRRAPSAPTADAQSLHELLNAIDGIAAQDQGRILFLTTNDLDALDAALTRPGRCDRTFFLGNADDEMAERLFNSFYADFDDDDDDDVVESRSSKKLVDNAKAFAALVGGERYSMAALQGHLLRHKSDALDALHSAKSHFDPDKKTTDPMIR